MVISDLKNPYIQLSRTKFQLFFKFDHWSLLVSVQAVVHLGHNASRRDAPPSLSAYLISIPLTIIKGF